MSNIRSAALALCLLPGFAAAQEDARSILVLDASGSMWGQIDGLTKIEIAQGVVADLLRALPETQELGLTAYGHRTKGDCTDIQTIVAPGPGTRDEIAAQVGKLRPRGKTPMTDAVVQAAEALRYTDEPATVILVSDGIETCNPDPCAAARALEAAGVALTVHVVGFDVSEPEALRQMQCIADETGGRFLMASNATELGSALSEVTQTQPAATYPTVLVAQDGENGGQIDSALIWNLSRGEEVLVDFQRDPTIALDLTAGTYTVSVLRPADEASVEKTFDVVDAGQTVTLVLPSSLPLAAVSGPESAVAGATVPITWEGPDAKGDYIAVSVPDDTGYLNYVYTREGSPGPLVMPPEPGTYELRYVLADGRVTLATQTIAVTEALASLEAAAEAPAGATIPVTWDGPDYQGDYITVSVPGDDGYVNYTYTRDGAPLDLQMPPEPGDYELRYVMAQDRTVLATRPITVAEVSATLDAPASAAAGAGIPVGWSGPDYQGDYITVSVPGDEGYVTYTYTREGTPLTLTMPAEPGTFEVRYVMGQKKRVLATQTIEVTSVSATLDAPDEARAGAPVLVGWDGPGYQPDYISVAEPGMEPGKYLAYTYVREGTPLILEMPVEPGTYEIRYVAASDGRTVIGTRPITLTEVTATLDAPDSIPAGGVLGVNWDGPDYKNDYIALAREGDPDNTHAVYAYTREDSPVVLKLPEGPGRYELRYVLGQDRKVIARKPVELTYKPAQ
ncbi:vWA domain-containing protein [Maliponia aquimaris]|uniref:von Willebrand factor type A domain protein n=1 Tax=Maliponia aquimaris TaxID=1673631 RepID=A0A238JZQ1_9RHOB|nr:VWA domain-containing protein [Maliponia aquimaris]SMX35983.1 von Willebrand factor type A domain protein [Maliponia aquimaris]